MIFSCPWDTKVSLITGAYVLVLLIVIVILSIRLVGYLKEKRILPIVLFSIGVLFFAGILIVSAMDCPCKISLENETLTIHRVQKNIVIPIENIEKIRLCNDTDTRDSKRTAGSGGAFGYLGKFRNAQLGNYLMYVTNRSQRILLKTDAKLFVFSCEQPEVLVNLVQQNIP